MHQLFTTISPAPPGFELVELTKRHLMSGPVCVLVEDDNVLSKTFPNYRERMLGVVLTLGETYQLEQITPYLWHVVLPRGWQSIAASLLQGWLSAISSADSAVQQFHAVEIRNERLSRELEFTRRDYNQLTQRLQEQLRELIAARDALSALNNQLEQRVTERTAQLEHANENLSKAVDDLRRAQDELARTAELVGLGSLVAGVAHELNTPIGTSLTVATSLAAETRSLHKQYHDGVLKRSAVENFLQAAEMMSPVLERNIRQAADIIERLRQLTSYQSTEARSIFMLDEIIDRAVVLGRMQLPGAEYQLSVQSHGSIELDSYPDAIAQILISLINNAAVHGFEGSTGGSIQIGYEETQHEGNESVSITVRDDGRGIPKENLQRIFHPFFSTRFGQGGSGLGLYVAYNKAQKLLGGKLTAISELACGACFVLTIPRIAP
jgi:C4-dicarboxylate-specific signal transduction histidine kinase